MSTPSSTETTPRPWYWEPGSGVLKTRIGSEGHRRGVGDYAFLVFDDTGRYADQGGAEADAALIVEAVNNCERWLAIEAAARALIETRSANVTGPDYQARKAAYATLREALEIE